MKCRVARRCYRCITRNKPHPNPLRLNWVAVLDHAVLFRPLPHQSWLPQRSPALAGLHHSRLLAGSLLSPLPFVQFRQLEMRALLHLLDIFSSKSSESKALLAFQRIALPWLRSAPVARANWRAFISQHLICQGDSHENLCKKHIVHRRTRNNRY